MTDFLWHRWAIAAVLLAATVASLWWAFTQPTFMETLAVLTLCAIVIVGVRFGLKVVVGLVYLAIVNPINWLLARRNGWLHGSARFSRTRELAKGPLTRPGGEIYLGTQVNFLGQSLPLASNGTENTLICGSSRSGKGVSNIVPSLLAWTGSCVVHDRKAELHSLSAGFRSTLGRVVKFAPGEIDSAKFNPLAEIRLGTEFEIGDAQNIATALIEEPEYHGEGQHWIDTARELVAGVIMFALHQDSAASLADVARALSDPARPIADLYTAMMLDPLPLVSGTARAMADRSEREASSIVSTALRALAVVRDPVVAGNIAASDFKLDDIGDGAQPLSVYVTTKTTDAARLRPLVRLFFEMCMAKLLGAELRFENGVALPAHKHRVLLAIDELPALGRLAVIEDGMAMCLGYGICVIAAIQSYTQLRKNFGQYEMISANCGISVYYPPPPGEDADRISRALGQTTIELETRSRSFGSSRSASDGGQGSNSRGTNVSTNISTQQHGRPLLFPDEVARLSKPERNAQGLIEKPGAVLIFQAGKRPVLGTQLLWWDDPEMRRRASLPIGTQQAPSNVVPFPPPRQVVAEGLRAAAIAGMIIVPTVAAVPLWRAVAPTASDSLSGIRSVAGLVAPIAPPVLPVLSPMTPAEKGVASLCKQYAHDFPAGPALPECRN